MNDEKVLEEFMYSLVKGIEKGLPEGYELKDDIEIELAVVKTKGGEGGLKIFVADIKGQYSKEELSKIKYKIGKVKKKSTLSGGKWNGLTFTKVNR